MQRYNEKQLVPKIQANSSPTCCDKGIDLRQSSEIGNVCVVKLYGLNEFFHEKFGVIEKSSYICNIIPKTVLI
jgi:hypothetical protein